VLAVKKVNDIVAEISTASDEQATGLDEINRAVGEMDTMTQQNAALVEQAAAASAALGSQAEALDGLLAFFDLGKAAEPASMLPRPEPAPRAARAAQVPARTGRERQAKGGRTVPKAAPGRTAGRLATRTVPVPRKAAVAVKPVYDNGDDKDWSEF
jgi:methyl-accepting chemotaxis protein